MRAKTRNRLWSAALWAAIAAALCGIVATARAFDASVLLPVMDSEQWTPAKLNPVAWWQGEYDATDSAGEHDGAWAGAAAYSTGIVGLAFDLAGTKKIDTDLYLPSGAVTLCAWAKVATHKNYNKLVGAGYLEAANGFGIHGRATTWSAQNRIGDSIVWPGVAHNGIAEWVHIVGMRTGAAVAIYTNGVFAVQQATAMAPESSAPLHIGGAVYGGYMTGLIDDVLVFNRALTPDEIALLYSESIARDGCAWP